MIEALVLAGSRGESDPLAQGQGIPHRALLEVAGVPMLLRVVRALRQTPEVGRVLISIDDPPVLDTLPQLAQLAQQGLVVAHRSLDSPSRSVLDALESRDEPLLVTTADHALLTPEMIEHMLARASALDADVSVGVVARPVVEARFPGVPRTWLRLRDDDYTGANLFVFHTPRARRAAAFWVRAESFRKRPWRLVAAFGPTALVLFALRRLSLDAALARGSRSIGARVEAVRLPFAEAAIDIDRLSDLEVANELLSRAEPTR